MFNVTRLNTYFKFNSPRKEVFLRNPQDANKIFSTEGSINIREHKKASTISTVCLAVG